MKNEEQNSAPKADKTMEEIVSLAKRRGFIFQGSEIYGGLAGTWDYGPLGVTLKNRVKKLWWNKFVEKRDDIYGLDAAILMNPKVWEASGHVGGFNDPLVDDLKNGRRHRADHLLEDAGLDVMGKNIEEMDQMIRDNNIKSPDGNDLGPVKQFNMMFKTEIGAAGDGSSVSYLRPETAGGIFVNFKNVMDSMHPKMPFGIAQIGKAFRNEIAPRDFIFRVREFEQMEIEYFVHPEKWEDAFEKLRQNIIEWNELIGLPVEKVHELEVPEEDRAHYSKRTIDFEFDYPFGRKELYGLAYRTDYDLSKHAEHSGAKLEYFDDQTGEKFMPHVVEPSLGVDRTILAILSAAYDKDNVGGEERTVLRLKPEIAPIKVAVFPLLKNKPELVEKAREVFNLFENREGEIAFDDNGNIGKRYRRQDEIGTPFCVTVDFDTLEDESVTVRDRDTGEQERVKIDEVVGYISEKLTA
jgi:glycyl-tRNA synthetase